MNGEIAQIAALTCHGNAFLSGKPEVRFFPGNSTCQYCERVIFVALKKSVFGIVRKTEVADTPDAWLALLKSRGALGIRLGRSSHDEPGIPDRMSAGFVGGGGTWMMEVLLPRQTSEFWVPRWEVGNRNAPDRKIWRVTYGCVSEAKTSPLTAPDLTRATRELAEGLKDIREFSVRQGTDGFTNWFDEALNTIAAKGSNQHIYHPDLAPGGFLSDEAAVLLDACQQAWVFGGMGSWNDLLFDGEDQRAYERVSEGLFEAVNRAIQEAATSSLKGTWTTGSSAP